MSYFSRIIGCGIIVTTLPITTLAQQPAPDHAAHSAATAQANEALIHQLAELQAKVGMLERAMQQRQAEMPGSTGGMQSMGGMGQMSGGSMPGMNSNSGGGMDNMMGMMGGQQPMGQMQGMSGGSGMGMGMMNGMMSGEMGGMGMGSMSGGGMSGMENMMSMMGMSPGANMGGMSTPSALPGFPGASHLYHIGSSGFFLDHGDHIALTAEQRTALNAIKEKALMTNANIQRSIDAAEQELWMLTASDQPDATSIEAKVHDIEALRVQMRMNFIRSVGDAANVLTDEQRKTLLGQIPHQQGGQPASSSGMGDM